MNRAEFTALPSSIALGILWDASPGLGAKLASVAAPRLPIAPKYDQAIYRKDGVSWASEYDVEGLRYWRDKKSQSSDPKYAEKDGKTVKALDFWIAWRVAFPAVIWSGERSREHVTAAPPAGKPQVYPSQSRNGSAPERRAADPAPFDDDGPSAGGDDFEDVPF